MVIYFIFGVRVWVIKLGFSLFFNERFISSVGVSVLVSFSKICEDELFFLFRC